MSPKSRFAVLAAAATLVACQPAPPTPPLPGTSAAPSAAPSAVAAPSAAPSALPSAVASASVAPSASPVVAPTPIAKREVVLGSIYNELGGQVEEAQLEVSSSDPAFNRKISGAGGAFGIRDVPVGTRLTLTASAPGYSARSRSLTVREVVPFVLDDPNRIDFGGRGQGMFSYLTRETDISRTIPVNQAKAVSTAPLKIDFFFARPIRESDQSQFDDLLRVRFPGLDDSSTQGGTVLRDGLSYRQARARIEWNAASTEASFIFDAPIVTSRGAAALVEFDPEADIEDYPQDTEGRSLGFQAVSGTKDGAGGTTGLRIAPFARPFSDEAIPNALPSPDVLWARSHHTSVRFELAQDTQPLQLLSAQPFKGATGKDDQFELTFNKPMRGFPEAFISAETTKRSNYRIVLGRTDDARERAAFEAADPATAGSPPSVRIDFDEQDPRKLILRDSSGSFTNFRRFKLYVSPAVVDIHGASFADGKGATSEGAL